MLADGFRWSADSDGEWLSIRARGAKQFCESLDPNKKYDVDIKEHQEKRSLDANAYCWVLIGKLAAKLRVPPNEVYRQYIQDIGGNYTIVPVKEDRIVGKAYLITGKRKIISSSEGLQAQFQLGSIYMPWDYKHLDIH